MTIVTVCGAKHSPGATTLAVALAAFASDTEPALLIEGDPAGGDLAARAGRSVDPGLMTLAAAGRRGATAQLLEAHAQILDNGVRALLAPPRPEQAAAAWHGVARSLSALLPEQATHVVIDAGRWDGGSASQELLTVSDAVLVVFRPTLEGVEHLRARLEHLRDVDTTLIATAVGDHPYPANEVRPVVEPVPVHTVAHDPRAASAVAAGAPIDRWLRRSAFVRSVGALVAHLSMPRAEAPGE